MPLRKGLSGRCRVQLSFEKWSPGRILLLIIYWTAGQLAVVRLAHRSGRQFLEGLFRAARLRMDRGRILLLYIDRHCMLLEIAIASGQCHLGRGTGPTLVKAAR
jgi:hypothetical protein